MCGLWLSRKGQLCTEAISSSQDFRAPEQKKENFFFKKNLQKF